MCGFLFIAYRICKYNAYLPTQKKDRTDGSGLKQDLLDSGSNWPVHNWEALGYFEDSSGHEGVNGLFVHLVTLETLSFLNKVNCSYLSTMVIFLILRCFPS